MILIKSLPTTTLMKVQRMSEGWHAWPYNVAKANQLWKFHIVNTFWMSCLCQEVGEARKTQDRSKWLSKLEKKLGTLVQLQCSLAPTSGTSYPYDNYFCHKLSKEWHTKASFYNWSKLTGAPPWIVW